MTEKVYKLLIKLKNRFLRRKYTYSICIVLFIGYMFCLPKPLFNDPLSTVITDSRSNLLGAKIADDGQWRFPHNEEVPEKFKQSIICFEDQYFYKHPGFNPVSLIRALYLNIKNKEVVSGGSTISMQVIRLARKNKSRTVKEKLIELVLATRLELKYSKDEILALYSSHAPFGGNVVGLEAASWRYFQRNANELSWAESATLAVLPNAPSLIFPGKNKNALKKKRNFLLEKLMTNGVIDSTTYELALLEPIPQKPYPLPQHAYHLLMEIYQGDGNSKVTQTTINSELQIELNEIIDYHAKKLSANKIHNIAAIVAEVKTGKILAYVGNANYLDDDKHGNKVNIITSARSSGSILKPLLYASAINDGDILPGTLLSDVPTNMTGFSPQNFDLKYDGAVPAWQALSRSLNIPSVRLLRKYSLEKFYFQLKKLGITTLDYPSSHYGLSLILGGAEVTLWDITGTYASLSRTLNRYNNHDGTYSPDDIRPLTFYKDQVMPEIQTNHTEGLLNGASIWLTYKALLEVNRPSEETGWQLFSNSKKIAWKTGTSFGFRDAWAIGTTPEYVVGVWAGNSGGEGRPGLVGVLAAAPIMFDIFEKLPQTSWFSQPYDEMTRIPVCKNSGHRTGEYCGTADTVWVVKKGLNSEVCPYHKIIHLDENEEFRVKSSCYSTDKMVHKSWFVLPPLQEYYYRTKHPSYTPLPPIKDECTTQNLRVMDLVYPSDGIKLYVPVELDGKQGEIVLEAVHNNPNANIFWHLNDKYIGYTNGIHQMGISPPKGEYKLTLVDTEGNEINSEFEIYTRE